jgi:sigma-B regulation protein RsbU (phosphoserine phosphatase)
MKSMMEANVRILVVDDSEDARDIVEAMLMSAGYTDVVTADSAWEALHILDLWRPKFDVVLLDIVMPKMNGIEICARIRNDARYSDLSIIMLTSLDDMDSVAEAFVVGANDYVAKPLIRAQLVSRVQTAVKFKT